MINKLKVRFIILCMSSLLALLSVIVIGMNIINYNSVVNEADEILALLSQNKGRFPDMGGMEGFGGMNNFGDMGNMNDSGEPNGMKGQSLPDHMSPELPYESRYFSVLLSESGDVIHSETSRIASVNTAAAIDYAQNIMKSERKHGFIDNFRYVRQSEENGIRITFLDCGRMLDSYRNFLLVSCIMAFAGYVIVFFVIVFFSGKIIRPIAESYEKQKRFITDAGHEIKTPLTIINANVDVLELELGQNECLEDIQQQTKRLITLTNDLVYLARMEEAQEALQMIEFPISDVIYETASAFKVLAQTQTKELDIQVQPMLSMRGNDKAIQQLISLLLDNALKYSPENSLISVKLERQNKALHLTVSNATEMIIEKEHLYRVFDRFYRTDPSRNSETGGHGIGLSVAKAIVSAHGGKIQAWTQDGKIFNITVMFPL